MSKATQIPRLPRLPRTARCAIRCPWCRSPGICVDSFVCDDTHWRHTCGND